MIIFGVAFLALCTLTGIFVGGYDVTEARKLTLCECLDAALAREHPLPQATDRIAERHLRARAAKGG